MSDLFAGVQFTFHHRQAEFLKIELETCLRSSNLASRMYETGNRDSAERTTADAEESYAMVLRFLSDPKGSKLPNHQSHSRIYGENRKASKNS
jgi:hypothetical protein